MNIQNHFYMFEGACQLIAYIVKHVWLKAKITVLQQQNAPRTSRAFTTRFTLSITRVGKVLL